MSTKTHFDAAFALKKPCGNCPFLKDGAIELAPGRLQSIAKGLLDDDHSNFHCHKTVYNERTGGSMMENDEGETKYQCSHKESFCAGAMILMEKMGHTSILMRVGRLMGAYRPDDLLTHKTKVIEPEQLGLQSLNK